MIEVFKTNVIDTGQANMLVDQINKNFTDYRANFDLQDCDNILRVKCITGLIQSSLLINLLREFGFNAEILTDEIPSSYPNVFSKEYAANKINF
ncbi:MAG: hypothetical protein H0V65_07325 [Chitinophagales bacterium]|nr:hypothetical protein [Chitinophagales bacterium]